MLPDRVSGRRLRFDLAMGERESIPGAIARGVRDHVMVRTAPVLAAADVSMKHIGYSQIAGPDELRRLAYVARVEAERFIGSAGEPVRRAADDKSMETRFGSLLMPRVFLELDRRRIGPLSLQEQGYHRLSWMNLLLPYCPESLEQLVDRCTRCGSSLGWRYAAGIGNCDICDEEIAPATEPALTEALAENYRLFAQLSSPHAGGVDAAIMLMPSVLRGVDPGQLVRLALLLGGAVHDETGAFSRNKVVELPAARLADVATTGTGLLRSWPTGLKEWVAGRTDELRNSPVEIERLRSRLRRIANRQLERSDIVDLVCGALPDLRMHAAHGFSNGGRYYLYKKVQSLLGLSSPRMDALKRWPAIEFLRLNTAGKEQGQFDVDQIDALVPAFRKTVGMSSCTTRLGLPLYAIEQLCGSGLLEWEDNGALLATGTFDRVRSVSLNDLIAGLKARAAPEGIPLDCTSLAVATKRIGGRLKPWATIIHALIDGRIRFWLKASTPTTASIMVRGRDLAAFQHVTDPAAPEGLPISPLINQLDTAEVLNISTALLSGIQEDLGLEFDKSGQGLATSRTQVLSIAAEIVSNAEASHHLGVHPKQVPGILDARRIRRRRGAWCRRHLIDESILPGVLADGRAMRRSARPHHQRSSPVERNPVSSPRAAGRGIA